jgi:hypothetical protein
MGKIFDNLSYNRKTVKHLGLPLEDLKGLYKKKENDYMSVLDTEGKISSALSKIETQAIDKPILANAQKLFRSTFDRFKEQGDLENRVLDTKRLANDLATNGLNELQKVSKQRGAYSVGLKERFDKGDINKTQYLRALKDSDASYNESGGVQKDETTGLYTGSYSGRPVADYIDVSKEVATVLKDFKADSLPLDFNGRRIIKTPEGFFLQGTQTQVTEGDLTKAAKQYISSNQFIQDQFDDDIYYEKRAAGKLTASKIKNALRGGISTDLANNLGLGDGDLSNVEEVLETKDISLDEAFSLIRKDQLTNESLALGVEKESYKKYSEKYIKPFGTGTSKGKGKTNKLATTYGEILTTTDIKQHIGKEEILASQKLIDSTTSDLKTLEGQLKALEKSPNVQEKARLTKEIDNANFVLNSLQTETRNAYRKIATTPTTDSYDKGYLSGERAKKDKALQRAFSGNAGRNNLIIKGLTQEITVDDYLGVATPEERAAYEDKPFNYYYASEADRKAGKKSFKTTFEETRERMARPRIEEIEALSKHLQSRIDNQKVPITLDYITKQHSLSFAKMTPAQRQAHPMAQIWDTTRGLQVANEYQFMSSANTNLDIKTHLTEKMDIGEDQIDWTASKLQPLFDYRADLRSGSYRPAMEMVVKVKDGRQGSRQFYKEVRVPVFYDNPNYNTKYAEQLGKYRKQLIDRNKTTPLSRSEMEILDRTNLNIYNSTKYGANLDRKNLYQVPNGSDTNVEVWDDINLNIRTYTENFADGNNFYVTQKTGDTVEFLGVDKNNQPLRLTESQLRDPEVLKKVNSGEYQLSGSNTVNGIKTILADMVLNYDTSQKENIAPKGFVNIKNDPSIRLSDTNTFEQTNINEKVYPNVRDLFQKYSSIVATDISRNEDTGVASSTTNSSHKLGNGAKAIDIRMNDQSKASKEAMQIHKLSVEQKRSLGIEKTIAHGEGNNYHLHIKFL